MRNLSVLGHIDVVQLLYWQSLIRPVEQVRPVAVQVMTCDGQVAPELLVNSVAVLLLGAGQAALAPDFEQSRDVALRIGIVARAMAHPTRVVNRPLHVDDDQGGDD